MRLRRLGGACFFIIGQSGSTHRDVKRSRLTGELVYLCQNGLPNLLEGEIALLRDTGDIVEFRLAAGDAVALGAFDAYGAIDCVDGDHGRS
ncbi:hypothetical protein SDC9_195705 [bioreactor metagenome]|uniref:Uncharacterized protein n=1 Tax=bioreactor metagenome TaxID=1076179 RepID=A0A645I9T6_9ZZZZ